MGKKHKPRPDDRARVVDASDVGGKVKKKKLELTPGSHEIKVVFGKKEFTHTLEVPADKKVTVVVNPKKKKAPFKVKAK